VESGRAEAGDWPLKRRAQHEGPCSRCSGRIFAIFPTGGEAHDCPVAEQLIATGKASKCPIGEKTYDSAELRLWLKDRGTKPVIPKRATESSCSALKGASTKNDAASRTPSAD
jgi:hypothetical protein